MPSRWASLLVLALAGACADAEPPPVVPEPVAMVVPPPPPPPPPPPVAPEIIAEFACEGEILHQSVERRTTSPIAFWLQIDRDLGVHGWLADIGAPLRLPGAVLEGRMRIDYTPQGRLIGGEITLDWPYVRDGAPLTLKMGRETFIRLGPRFTRRAGDQTTLSAVLRFATESHPRLAGLRHAAAITATCLPGPDLPPGPVTE